ncbi:hypothetical protein [Pseudoalteromonas spongiae]|uniref:hypothetical protein n=1 Tax=Pseudoalteromonas spongiae TaxID=298657 RepID=UPI003737104F
MKNRSFILSLVTCAMLLAFYALSRQIGQPQLAFVIVAALLFSFSLYSQLVARNKLGLSRPALEHYMQRVGEK